jgi:hypothetical protein
MEEEKKSDAPVQAGGHVDVIRFEEGGTILKLMRPERDAELNFYEEIKDLDPLNKICPAYLGQVKEGENVYIRMKNLYHNLTEPGYIDIKLGANYHDHESAEAIAYKIKKQELSTRREYAFCVCGSMHYTADGGRETFDLRAKPIKPKWWPMLNDFLKTFLMSSGRTEINLEALNYFIKKFEEIEAYVDGGTNPFYFISASLFLILSNKDNHYEVKLIDFGKVDKLATYGKEKDTRFLKGLRNVLKWFKELRDLETKKD